MSVDSLWNHVPPTPILCDWDSRLLEWKKFENFGTMTTRAEKDELMKLKKGILFHSSAVSGKNKAKWRYWCSFVYGFGFFELRKNLDFFNETNFLQVLSSLVANKISSDRTRNTFILRLTTPNWIACKKKTINLSCSIFSCKRWVLLRIIGTSGLWEPS